MLKTKFDKSR